MLQRRRKCESLGAGWQWTADAMEKRGWWWMAVEIRRNGASEPGQISRRRDTEGVQHHCRLQ